MNANSASPSVVIGRRGRGGVLNLKRGIICLLPRLLQNRSGEDEGEFPGKSGFCSGKKDFYHYPFYGEKHNLLITQARSPFTASSSQGQEASIGGQKSC